MPSKSKRQRNLMAAAAHDPAFAKKAGVPQSVAREFNQADRKLGPKALPERVRKKSGPKGYQQIR